MNDFTKKELEALIETFDQAERECSEDWMPVLKRKILLLIENYHCIHESDGLIYTSNPPKNKCKKCGAYYR